MTMLPEERTNLTSAKHLGASSIRFPLYVSCNGNINRDMLKSLLLGMLSALLVIVFAPHIVAYLIIAVVIAIVPFIFCFVIVCRDKPAHIMINKEIAEIKPVSIVVVFKKPVTTLKMSEFASLGYRPKPKLPGLFIINRFGGVSSVGVSDEKLLIVLRGKKPKDEIVFEPPVTAIEEIKKIRSTMGNIEATDLYGKMLGAALGIEVGDLSETGYFW